MNLKKSQTTPGGKEVLAKQDSKTKLVDPSGDIFVSQTSDPLRELQNK